MTVSALSTFSHERSESNTFSVLFIFGTSRGFVSIICVLWLVAVPDKSGDATSEAPEGSGFAETLDASLASFDFVTLSLLFSSSEASLLTLSFL